MSSAFRTSLAPLRTPAPFDARSLPSSFSYRSPDHLAYLRVPINQVTWGDDIVIFLLDYVAVSTVRSVYKLGLDTLMKKHVSPTHSIFVFDSQSTEWLGLPLVFVVISREPTEWLECLRFRLREGRLTEKSGLWFEPRSSLVPCSPTRTPFLALFVVAFASIFALLVTSLGFSWILGHPPSHILESTRLVLVVGQRLWALTPHPRPQPVPPKFIIRGSFQHFQLYSHCWCLSRVAIFCRSRRIGSPP